MKPRPDRESLETEKGAAFRVEAILELVAKELEGRTGTRETAGLEGNAGATQKSEHYRHSI